jgi:hypothetical protein
MGLAGRLRSAARTFVGLGSCCLRPSTIPLGVCLDLSALHVLDSTADPITLKLLSTDIVYKMDIIEVITLQFWKL